MAALSFFIISILFIIGCLAFLFIKSRAKAKEAINTDTDQSELIKLRESEHHLQEEVMMLKNKMHHMFEDPITKLLGWQLFEDRLNQSIKESGRYQLSLGVLFIDIDDFKVINNALGYEVGDALLKQIAERLQLSIRQVDSVSRFTKDTFVILLAQLSKPETVAIVAQRILQALAQVFQIQDHELYITAHIGIALYPADGLDSSSLLRNADHALHLAKGKGKHLYQFYQEQLHIDSQRELLLNMGLSHEAVFTEFLIYYQPIINISDESVICMDTLLFWKHPELGLINPTELFQFAEKQRKLNSITEWLLHNACRQYLYWRSVGFCPALLGMPITVKQLENSHFIYRISQILQEVEFNPEWLLLEIKDDCSQISFEVLEKAINMLKYMGVKVAIDHFGTTPFPLSHFKKLSIHYLKLAPSFIEDLSTNEQTVALTKSIVFLAKTMSIELITQGVESDQQMQILKQLGCTLMQGHSLGQPLSEQEVTVKMVAPIQ